MTATNLVTKDFGTFENDISHGPFVPATVSFKVQWSGVLDRIKIRDPEKDFGGDFILDTATLEWSATETGPGSYIDSFVSDPADTSDSAFATQFGCSQ